MKWNVALVASCIPCRGCGEVQRALADRESMCARQVAYWLVCMEGSPEGVNAVGPTGIGQSMGRWRVPSKEEVLTFSSALGIRKSAKRFHESTERLASL